MTRIEEVMPVVVVPLLARALLAGDLAGDDTNLKNVLDAQLSASTVKASIVPPSELIAVANQALAQLAEREIVELKDGAWSILPNNRPVLTFYASSIAHYY
jgi:glycerol-3-phosphate O-acyltransferase